MTNEEMNTFIAEKVHGRHKERIEFGVGKRWIWLDASGEKQISVRSYSPATNVAQAVEALRAWLNKFDDEHELDGAFWNLSWGVEDENVMVEIHIAESYRSERYYQAEAATESRAICDALVKAVSDDLAR